MHMLIMKKAFIMDALEEQVGWHGRTANGIYISAVYEDKGLYVHTVERCLYYIPRDELQYEQGYDAMRLELTGKMVWPDLPVRGLPQGIKQTVIHVERGNVVDTLQELTGLSKKEIQARLSESAENQGVARFEAPAEIEEETEEPIIVNAIDGFTPGECREAAIALMKPVSDNTDTTPLTLRPRLKLLEDKTRNVKKGVDLSTLKYPIVPSTERGFTLEDVKNSRPIPYEYLLHNIDKDIESLRTMLVVSEDEHNDEILDEYNTLCRRRELLMLEWGETY